VVVFNEAMKAVNIVEKPKEFISEFAQTGMYIYDNRAVEFAKTLKPSARGELEITDLNNIYLQKGELDVHVLNGEWVDAGTFESLYRANELAYKKAHNL